MARKNTPAIISGAGWVASFMDELIRGLRERGCSDEEIHALVTSGGKLPMDKIVSSVAEVIQASDCGIVAPAGGKIHVVSVPVDESRPWDEAVRAAGPNTPAGYAVWKMGDHYPPSVGRNKESQEVILVNFGKYIRSEDALLWGKEQRLRPVTPRACLAIGEHCPTLHHDRGLDYMAVVTLGSPCSFEGESVVVCVWFGGSVRLARLYWFDGGWIDLCRFAFSRE